MVMGLPFSGLATILCLLWADYVLPHKTRVSKESSAWVS